jgi:hypothetical protein
VFIIKDITSEMIISEMIDSQETSVSMDTLLFLKDNELILQNFHPKKNQIYVIILDTLKTLADIYTPIKIIIDTLHISEDQILIATLFDFRETYAKYLRTENKIITHILTENWIKGIPIHINIENSKLDTNSEDKFDATLNIDYKFTILGL